MNKTVGTTFSITSEKELKSIEEVADMLRAITEEFDARPNDSMEVQFVDSDDDFTEDEVRNFLTFLNDLKADERVSVVSF